MGIDACGHPMKLCFCTCFPSMVPVAYPAQSPRLLELVRESFRYKHYSLKTEETYVYWASFFVRRQKRPGAMRQPREMGTSEVLTDRFAEHARLTATGLFC
jgi:hypothetical protein